eukprot:1303126-Amphidinium_carterae.1
MHTADRVALFRFVDTVCCRWFGYKAFVTCVTLLQNEVSSTNQQFALPFHVSAVCAFAGTITTRGEMVQNSAMFRALSKDLKGWSGQNPRRLQGRKVVFLYLSTRIFRRGQSATNMEQAVLAFIVQGCVGTATAAQRFS